MSAGRTTARRPHRREAGRKDRIVEVTLDVLAEHGVAGTTHRLIAEAADVPLGSLTYYFTGLADLREQAFRRAADRLSERYAAYLDTVTSHDELIDAVTDLITDQAGANARDMALAYELYLAALREPALRAITEDWMRRSRRALEGYLDPVTARGLDALIEGLVMHNALSTAPLGREQIRGLVRKATTKEP